MRYQSLVCRTTPYFQTKFLYLDVAKTFIYGHIRMTNGEEKPLMYFSVSNKKENENEDGQWGNMCQISLSRATPMHGGEFFIIKDPLHHIHNQHIKGHCSRKAYSQKYFIFERNYCYNYTSYLSPLSNC